MQFFHPTPHSAWKTREIQDLGKVADTPGVGLDAAKVRPSVAQAGGVGDGGAGIAAGQGMKMRGRRPR